MNVPNCCSETGKNDQHRLPGQDGHAEEKGAGKPNKDLQLINQFRSRSYDELTIYVV
jgi:hypothetical protein